MHPSVSLNSKGIFIHIILIHCFVKTGEIIIHIIVYLFR